MPMNALHKNSLPENPALSVNSLGHLVYNGCDMAALAQDYGTPLYVMNEDGIRENCRLLKNEFMNRHPNTFVLYASKAFSTLAMYQIIKEEGLGIDVVSGGELHTALQAGIPMADVYFHGNNKSEEEITLALEVGVGRFVVDSYWEMEMLDRISGAMGKRAAVLLRISPGIDAHTHEYLQTGVLDCKFGFPVAGGMALEAFKRVLGYEHLEFMGIHCHIGSQIFTPQAYRDAVAVMMTLLREMKESHHTVCRELNLGGGFGIRYIGSDSRFKIIETLDFMVSDVESYCSTHQLERPRILIEPGRWIVGENGLTLYTIGTQKEIPGIRKYISVDGGMADNPRPALYQADYQSVVANRLNAPETQNVTIAGKCCESGDLLIRDANLPEVHGGDILAILSTGAYTYAMSSNYNRLRKPPVVMIRGGIPLLIVKGETYADVVRNDIPLEQSNQPQADNETL